MGGWGWGGWIYWDSDRQTDRQTADRLSRAELILHSPAAGWSPPAASPLSPATCLSENNTAASGRAQPEREACPVCHLSGFHWPSPLPPSLCPPVCVLREDRLLLRTGRAWRPGFVCRYQERSAQLSGHRQSCDGSHWTGLPPQRSHLHGGTMATFVCRVQFLDDTDPFNSTNFPEPTRPPLYTFREDIPLINQLAGVHRLLKAPHKVRWPLSNSSYT